MFLCIRVSGFDKTAMKTPRIQAKDPVYPDEKTIELKQQYSS